MESRLITVDVIPGITSAIAMAACTKIPLTHRGMASSVAFVTGHSGDDAQTPDADTLVYYMAGEHFSTIACKLIACGRDAATPVATVHNVSLPGQKTFFATLGEMRFSAVKYPTPVLFVVGRVVSLESGRADCQPVLYTGTVCDADPRRPAVHTPLITLRKSPPDVLRSITADAVSAYHWIVFTSRYGVRFFFELLDEIAFDVRSLGGVKIAAVGEVTAGELKKHHLTADIVSATESAEGLIDCFRDRAIANCRILLPRSDRALQILPDALRALGNEVTDVPVYTNTVNASAERLDLSGFNKILFGSPSGVEAFIRLYGELPEGIPLIAKGKTTETKLKSYI